MDNLPAFGVERCSITEQLYSIYCPTTTVEVPHSCRGIIIEQR